MLEIRNNDIYLTRGDTAQLTIGIRNDVTSMDYEMQPTDALHLTVRRQPSAESMVLISKVAVGNCDIKLTPDDTAKISTGRYVYDAELHTGDDVYTVIQCKTFNLLPEVTML